MKQDKAMIGCSQTRKLIDEADNAEVYSYEASRHIASCSPCKDFAEERTGLRHLLSSSARVAAPANFDALLGVRLAAARSERPLARKLALLSALSGPAGLLKFGAATATVALGVFVASYSGLFSTPPQNETNNFVAGSVSMPREPAPPVATLAETPTVDQQVNQQTGPKIYIATGDGPRRAKRQASRPVIIEPDLAAAGGQTVILRGDNFEREVPMPTVSVGAQPLLFVGTGRSPSGGIRASF
jgi:hypothetical protein